MEKIKVFKKLNFTILLICSLFLFSLIFVQIDFIKTAKLIDLISSDFWHAIALSVFCASIASIIGLALAIPSAFTLSRFDFRGRKILDTLIDIPIMISPVALGLALLVFFRTESASWIENNFIRFIFEVPGIILGQTILVYSISTRVLKSAFDSINPRFEFVAKTLGASDFQIFYKITLPLIKKSILAALVLGWTRAISDFGVTSTVAGAVKGKTETIPVSIYLNMASLNINKAIALSLFVILIGFAFVILLKQLGNSNDRN